MCIYIYICYLHIYIYIYIHTYNQFNHIIMYIPQDLVIDMIFTDIQFSNGK